MTKPSVRRFTIPKDAHHRLLIGYGAATLIPVIVLLVYLVGSLLFSGAQVIPDGRQAYDAPIPFPIFVVPAWISVTLAIVAAVLVVPLILTTRAIHANHLIGMASYTVGAVLADGFFSVAFPSQGGLIPSPGDPGSTLGYHVIAAGLGIVCIVILVVRMLVIGPEYERLRKAGELPNGYW